MKNLNEIEYWKHKLGLLPIHLFSLKKTKNSFIMLNGGSWDFCLQTNIEDKNPEDYFSYSWSSNTKNFVVLNRNKVNVYNWKKNVPESFPVKQVEGNFEKFYKYLVSNSYKTTDDVVPFIVDIFKEFRNITQEKNNAVEALNLLYLLLTTLKEDVASIDFDKWALCKIKIPSNFDSYAERFKQGVSNIKPKLELIMRHSAGVLFQEAQKEVLFFDRQMDIWGNLSNKYDSKNLQYSSIHCTPTYLARTIVENVIQELDLTKKSLKILDPACGSSEFLIEVLKQLKEKNYSGKIEIIGWDSSQISINTSNFLLKYEQNHIWKEKMTFNIRLVEDSLLEEWTNDFDLILMNPPFVSWERMSKNARGAVKEVLGSNLEGKPNQASAFFYRAVRSLISEGVIGCVIPSSLLYLDAYNKLRNEIYEEISLNLIGKLGNFVFEDALTDVSLIIGKKQKKENTTPYVLWIKNEKGIAQNALRNFRKMQYSNNSTKVEKDYSIYRPISFPITIDNWKLISYQENELFKKIERFVADGKLVRVKDIFNVQQGIRTGNNAVFKITKMEFNEILENENKYFIPIVDNEAIKNGIIKITKYVWFPYSPKNTDLLINSENSLKNMVKSYYANKLLPNKKILSSRKKSIPYWWCLSDRAPRLFPLKPQIVSTEFGRSDSFAFDNKGLFAVERGNAWLLKKEFKDIDYYYFYLALFSSPFFDKLLSIYSKQLAGGNWYDLGKKYTRNIPIPKIISTKNNYKTDTSTITKYHPIFLKLAQFGKEISEGNFFESHNRDQIIKDYIYQIE
jgi:hypothetical protein